MYHEREGHRTKGLKSTEEGVDGLWQEDVEVFVRGRHAYTAEHLKGVLYKSKDVGVYIFTCMCYLVTNIVCKSFISFK